MRVEEAGESECQPVMGWIRVQKIARRENEQTSSTVLNHGKRSGGNNCIGVEDDIISWY